MSNTATAVWYPLTDPHSLTFCTLALIDIAAVAAAALVSLEDYRCGRVKEPRDVVFVSGLVCGVRSIEQPALALRRHW